MLLLLIDCLQHERIETPKASTDHGGCAANDTAGSRHAHLSPVVAVAVVVDNAVVVDDVDVVVGGDKGGPSL